MNNIYERRFIHVGEIFVGIRPTEIVTVLGSCIAICLYDKVERIGGMNHYLLPLWNGNGLQSPRFGNISIPKLIDNMLNIGCRIENMEAKVCGGSNIHNLGQKEMMVGKKNIVIAKEILAEYRISIKAIDIGGDRGRRIMFKSDSGKIILKYTQKTN